MTRLDVVKAWPTVDAEVSIRCWCYRTRRLFMVFAIFANLVEVWRDHALRHASLRQQGQQNLGGVILLLGQSATKKWPAAKDEHLNKKLNRLIWKSMSRRPTKAWYLLLLLLLVAKTFLIAGTNAQFKFSGCFFGTFRSIERSWLRPSRICKYSDLSQSWRPVASWLVVY